MVFDQTTFSIDLIGRYVCNTWDEAINSGGPSYDVVVIGAGMFGGYCAEKIYRFAKEAGKTPRILVLDAGSLLLTQHEQNYPRISPNTGPFKVVRSNSEDPGPQEAVWGYPWRSNQDFPGLAYTEDEHVLLCVMHHIVTDGWSVQVYLRELASLYAALAGGSGAGAAALAELAFQYADFAEVVDLVVERPGKDVAQLAGQAGPVEQGGDGHQQHPEHGHETVTGRLDDAS